MSLNPCFEVLESTRSRTGLKAVKCKPDNGLKASQKKTQQGSKNVCGNCSERCLIMAGYLAQSKNFAHQAYPWFAGKDHRDGPRATCN